jgi:hypothetical protein
VGVDTGGDLGIGVGVAVTPKLEGRLAGSVGLKEAVEVGLSPVSSGLAGIGEGLGEAEALFASFDTYLE